MLEFEIIYFNTHKYQHSVEIITIPTAQIIGASQEDIMDILDSSRKYNSMDCVYRCIKGHKDVIAFVPVLRKLEKKENNSIFG